MIFKSKADKVDKTTAKQKKRVLVTGATGFIGANLVRRLIKEGQEVFVLIRKGSNLWRIEEIKSELKMFEAPLEDSERLAQVIEDIKPQVIFHLATYGGFSNQGEPDKIIGTNVAGTANLLAACIKTGFELFVNTGSSSEYGIKEHPMSENDATAPISEYGATKEAISLLLQRIAKSKNLNIVTMRPFAVYGYFEEGERLIPHIILSCLTNHDPRLSTPRSVRDFIFIEDLVDGYMATMEKKDIAGEIFNLGSGVQYSIGDIARFAIELSGKSLRPVYGIRPSTQKVEPTTWVADISKAKDRLGWEPKHDIRKGLSKSIEWFKANRALYGQ